MKNEEIRCPNCDGVVEEKQFLDGLWYPKYVGEVCAETNERYLVEKRICFFIGKTEWVPKDGGMMRCKEVKQK